MRKRNQPRRTTKPQPIGPEKFFVVDGLTHEAKGVARSNGKVIFIDGAIPNETVTARITKSGRRFDEAQLSTITKTSEYRVEPLCSHFATCGGCSFQHILGEQQTNFKADWLRGQLRHLQFDQELSFLSDQTTQYRRRARIAIEQKGNSFLFGFRGKASKKITSIDQCVVLTKALQSTFSLLKSALLNNPLSKKLGHVELLEDSRGVSVLLRLTGNIADSVRAEWQRWAEQQRFSLYWQNSQESKASVSLEEMRHYDLVALRLFYHPQDFIQVNGPMNQKMVTQALEWLSPTEDDVILDLFCGVGNFSLPLAEKAGNVIGVEVQESMVEAAKRNANYNNLTNLSFIAADLTQPVADLFLKKNVTKILLDPPRAGAFEFLETLVKIQPKTILYVSCNASTLARDAEYLVAQGYRVLHVSLMDMFPQTSHVETMMLLQKKT